MEQLAEAYEQHRPWVTIHVQTFNAAVAEERLREGAADLAAVPIAGGQDPLPWSAPFATDRLAIVVHPSAPIEAVDRMQLQYIFRGAMGEFEGGTPIQVVSREEGAGTRTIFENQVMEGYDVTLAAIVMPGDEEVTAYVARTPGAIGYVSLGRMGDNVRALVVEGSEPSAAGSSPYPLQYPLFLATPSEPEGEVREFIQWILGPEGQQRVATLFAPVHR
jgi:phosphate transport system substrate-binding protein